VNVRAAVSRAGRMSEIGRQEERGRDLSGRGTRAMRCDWSAGPGAHSLSWGDVTKLSRPKFPFYYTKKGVKGVRIRGAFYYMLTDFRGMPQFWGSFRKDNTSVPTTRIWT
jgi:hypothetical protein